MVPRPARYTLLSSLGLALLAGRGLDRSLSPMRFWGGLAVAVLIGVSAWIWSLSLVRDPLFRTGMEAGTLPLRLGTAALFWGLSLAAVICWRVKLVGPWAPLLVLAIELGGLFYLGPVAWGWSIGLPDTSPVLRQLGSDAATGLVAGRLQNLPVLAGRSAAVPALGIAPPPPGFLLESALLPPGRLRAEDRRWQNRLGITDGIWAEPDDVAGLPPGAEVSDPALARLFPRSTGQAAEGRWKQVHYPPPLPFAWVALRAFEVGGWEPLFATLSQHDQPGEAWFVHGDGPPEVKSRHVLADFVTGQLMPRAVPVELGRSASRAEVKVVDARTMDVEHDGTCYLILRRTFDPGWLYRIDGKTARPVLKVNGGLQCIPVTGTGPSHVTLAYQPAAIWTGGVLSALATAAALLVLTVDMASTYRTAGRPVQSP